MELQGLLLASLQGLPTLVKSPGRYPGTSFLCLLALLRADITGVPVA